MYFVPLIPIGGPGPGWSKRLLYIRTLLKAQHAPARLSACSLSQDDFQTRYPRSGRIVYVYILAEGGLHGNRGLAFAKTVCIKDTSNKNGSPGYI